MLRVKEYLKPESGERGKKFSGGRRERSWTGADLRQHRDGQESSSCDG
ncbi:hypothetical protein [Rhodococcus opacus]|nr:hypothetical protein [Rhodococcus opacus]